MVTDCASSTRRRVGGDGQRGPTRRAPGLSHLRARWSCRRREAETWASPAVKAAQNPVTAERRSILPLLRDYARLEASRATRWTSPTKWSWPLPSPLDSPRGAEERSRYRVVLLDEFQDTSEVSSHLLRSIFAPASGPVRRRPSTIPISRSIRLAGASSTTLRQFRDDSGAGAARRCCPSTSWRNDRQHPRVSIRWLFCGRRARPGRVLWRSWRRWRGYRRDRASHHRGRGRGRRAGRWTPFALPGP